MPIFSFERKIFYLFQDNLFQSRLDQILKLKQRMEGKSRTEHFPKKTTAHYCVIHSGPRRVFLLRREEALVVADGPLYKISGLDKAELCIGLDDLSGSITSAVAFLL